MNERRIKLIGITCGFLVTAVNGWIFDTDDKVIIFIRILFVLLGGIIQWESVLHIIRKSRKKYPQLEQVKQRVLFTLGQSVLLSFALSMTGDYLLDHLVDKKPFLIEWTRVLSITAGACYFSMTSIGLFEAVYYYSNYNRAELEKKELLRANLQSQLDSLKGQVNPHFLFNSLNSLSSLIMVDPQKAEAFVEELSTVYRYLLKGTERTLITLQEEIQFIASYNYLLTTRFGDNLQINIQVAGHYLDHLLPPLTLQLLVENAVKHNIISNELPLRVDIFTTASDRLHVVNNLQKKTRGVLSEKMGLSNIMAKYNLLHQPDVEVKETNKEFIVIVPLIKDEEYESIHH